MIPLFVLLTEFFCSHNRISGLIHDSIVTSSILFFQKKTNGKVFVLKPTYLPCKTFHNLLVLRCERFWQLQVIFQWIACTRDIFSFLLIPVYLNDVYWTVQWNSLLTLEEERPIIRSSYWTCSIIALHFTSTFGIVFSFLYGDSLVLLVPWHLFGWPIWEVSN